MNFRTLLISFLLFAHVTSAFAKGSCKIGLLVVATGKYIHFVEPLLKTARKHFCPSHQVTYFIFTDGKVPQAADVIKIEQQKLGWPYDTLMRFVMYHNQAALLSSMDYLFSCDADMLFMHTMGDEILSPRVAVLAPGYIGCRGTYETRPISTACVGWGEERKYEAEGFVGSYFAGGFYGGTAQEMLKMYATVTHNIEADLKKDFIALWHDESHLNRYFIDNLPTKVLSPLYCYPECYKIQRPHDWAKYVASIRLLDVVKNWDEMRK